MSPTILPYQRHAREFQAPDEYQSLLMPALARLAARGEEVPTRRESLLYILADDELAAAFRWLTDFRKLTGNRGRCAEPTCWYEKEGAAWRADEDRALASEIKRRIKLGRYPNADPVFRRDIEAWANAPAGARS